MAQRISTDTPAPTRTRTARPKAVTAVVKTPRASKQVSLVEAGTMVREATKRRPAKPKPAPARTRTQSDRSALERSRTAHPARARVVVEHDEEPTPVAPVVKMAKADRKAKQMSLDERIAPAVVIGVLALVAVLLVVKLILSGPAA